MTSRRHLVLIDGSGFLYRAYYALPPLCRSDGTPIGAVYGFTNMLSKFLAQIRAEMIAVLFDAPGPGFRHRLYPRYKAQRPKISPDLAVQVALVREATRAFGIRPIEVGGFEADDLIATYARLGIQTGMRVTIVSADKDLMQLVGPEVRIFDPVAAREIGEAEVRDKFGVGPAQVVDVQALCGDPIDNVPGVPGIGVKTAAQLINAYGNLDRLFAHLDEIMPAKRRQALCAFEHQARLSLGIGHAQGRCAAALPLIRLRRQTARSAEIVAVSAADGVPRAGGADHRANVGGSADRERAMVAVIGTRRGARDHVPPRPSRHVDLPALRRWLPILYRMVIYFGYAR